MFKNIRGLIGSFARDESGTETVEWAIVAGLLILAAAAAWGPIGTKVQEVLNDLLAALGS